MKDLAFLDPALVAERLRAAEALCELVGTLSPSCIEAAGIGAALEALEGAEGLWPLNDFGDSPQLVSGRGARSATPTFMGPFREPPLEPGERTTVGMTFPTDKTVIVRRVRAPRLRISIFTPGGSLFEVMNMHGEAPNLWLVYPARTRFEMTLENATNEEVPVHGNLSIEGYILK